MGIWTILLLGAAFLFRGFGISEFLLALLRPLE